MVQKVREQILTGENNFTLAEVVEQLALWQSGSRACSKAISRMTKFGDYPISPDAGENGIS
jgi:hypothetical protein